MKSFGIYVLFFLLGFLWVQESFGAGLDCSGYPEKRVLLGSQSWWADARTPYPGAHLHLTTCFPLHQKVRGIIHFDVLLQLHNMQGNGAITLLRNAIKDNGSDTTKKSLSLKCDVADCGWIIPLDVDTSKQTYDGRWEFRMTANVPATAARDRLYQSTRWHAILDNGKPVKNGAGSASRSPGASGWYTGVKYMNVHCGINDSGYKFVAGPQSGVASVTCSFGRSTAFASIDPNFHVVPPQHGTVLLQTSGGTRTVTVDTRTLVNGTHVLFLSTGATGTSPKGVGSGVLVLPFTVAN